MPGSNRKLVPIRVVAPYSFSLALRSMKSFQPADDKQRDTLRLATMVDGVPTLIEVSQDQRGDSSLVASSLPDADVEKVRSIVERVLFAELDLSPFYGVIAANSKLKALTERLRGLKPMRPVSLFEMAVIAITEQQISLAAAYRIRSRLVERFGVAVEEQRVFPEAQALASATIEDLRSCGLSRQKAGYIRDIAVKAADGTLDLDALKTMDDDTAHETITGWRGFGRWSADYILVRGLARPDCVPIDDLGVRSVIGEYLGNGERASVADATEMLEPFRPYRGLLAFYLLADYRLARSPG